MILRVIRIIYTIMVRYILHLADLHTRAGNTEASRFHEYNTVFTRIVESFREFHGIHESAIFLAGDIFHHKLKIESAGLKIIIAFLKQLGELAPVYIIRGNHDYLQQCPDEPDLVSAILNLHIPNIHYLDETKHTMISKNVGVGVVAISDALHAGNSRGIAPILPEFPKPKDNMINIALFHGAVSKTRLPNGMIMDDAHTYPLKWFTGYDALILGDIHLQQVHDVSKDHRDILTMKHTTHMGKYTWSQKGLPRGYCGSTVQQDFGEALLGHGFMVWDVQEKNVSLYHVWNDYGFVTARLEEKEKRISVLMKRQEGSTWISADNLVTKEWFPKNIYLRVCSPATEDVVENNRRVCTFFRQQGINIVHTRNHLASRSNEGEIETSPEKDMRNMDLAEFNTKTSWIEYVSEQMEKNPEKIGEEWKQWFAAPEMLSLPLSKKECGGTVEQYIVEKKNKFEKKLKEYTKVSDATREVCTSKKPFRICKIEWNYLLSFQEQNVFDFEAHDGCVSAIVAKNGCGKSNLLEIICIALYGNGFPSRYNKTYSSCIINNAKPKNKTASTKLWITVDGILYVLRRTFATQSKDTNKIVLSHVSLDRKVQRDTSSMKGIKDWENIHTGKTAVDEWVDRHIGKISSFLLSCLVSQAGDYDFFALKPAEQKELLDHSLGIHVASAFHTLIKDARYVYKDVIGTLQTIKSTEIDSVGEDYINGVGQTVRVEEIAEDERKIAQYQEAHAVWEKERDALMKEMAGIDYVPIFKMGRYTVRKEVERLQELGIPEEDEVCTMREKMGALKSAIANIQMDDIEGEDNMLSLEEAEEALQNIWEPEISLEQIQRYDEEYKAWQKQYAGRCLKDVQCAETLQKKCEDLERKTRCLLEEQKRILDNEPQTRAKETWDAICEWEKKRHNVDEKEFAAWKKYKEGGKVNTEVLCAKKSWLENEIKRYCAEEQWDEEEMVVRRIKKATQRMGLRTARERVRWWNEELRAKEKECMARKEMMVIIEENYDDVETSVNNLNVSRKKIVALEKRLRGLRRILKSHNTLEEIEWLLKKQRVDTWKDEIATVECVQKSAEKYKHMEEWEAIISTEDYWKKEKELLCAEKEWHRQWKICNEERLRVDSELLHAKTEWEEACLQYNYQKENAAWEERMASLEDFRKQWEKRKDALRKVEQVKAVTWKKELGELESIMDIVEEKKCMCAYQTCLRLWDRWSQMKYQEVQLRNMRNEIDQLREKCAVAKSEHRRCISTLERIASITEYIHLLQGRLHTLEFVEGCFIGFKEWVYKERAMEYIVCAANQFIGKVADGGVRIGVDVVEGGNFFWYIQIADTRVPLDRASGFQRMICSLGMRLALGKLGSSGANPTQFFIDEMFSSCDYMHLERVGELLHSMLYVYTQVIVVSHLDEIERCADRHIKIVRDKNNASRIV